MNTDVRCAIKKGKCSRATVELDEKLLPNLEFHCVAGIFVVVFAGATAVVHSIRASLHFNLSRKVVSWCWSSNSMHSWANDEVYYGYMRFGCGFIAVDEVET